VDGQATLLTTRFGAEPVADTLTEIRAELRTADLARIRELEAQAASYYFATWTRHLDIPFIERDAARIPDHWRTFTGRGSMLNYGRPPRRAADPINAILNYAYALAEADLKLAIAAVGLDPGLGILHSDTKNRASLALDLIEPLRPVIDDAVLELLNRRHLLADDLHETRQGSCRLVPPLTHEIAELAVAWQPLAGRWAERGAHLLAVSSTLPIP
jgi:CRISPR-associated endonuclease Cas1